LARRTAASAPLGEELHQREPQLGGEAADRKTPDLALERGDEARVRVAEARHRNAGKEVEVIVAD
jgi:hypothetical protein